MTTLDQWATAAAHELSLEPPDGKTQRLVLDVAREVAHNALRPAAPLSTFLLGLAVGRGASLEEAAAAVIEMSRRDGSPES